MKPETGDLNVHRRDATVVRDIYDGDRLLMYPVPFKDGLDALAFETEHAPDRPIVLTRAAACELARRILQLFPLRGPEPTR